MDLSDEIMIIYFAFLLINPSMMFSHDVEEFITRLLWIDIFWVYTMQCLNIKAYKY